MPERDIEVLQDESGQKIVEVELLDGKPHGIDRIRTVAGNQGATSPTEGLHLKYQGERVSTTISLRAFQRFQYGVVTVLVILGTVHYLLREFVEPTTIHQITTLFDVGKEQSITTAFATLNLFVASILLFAVYVISKFRCERIAIYWLILCIIFVLLSIDETATIHEKAGRLDGFTGFDAFNSVYTKWVIYGAIFAGAVFFFFIPLLLALPRRTAAMILLSGGIFIIGALGFEYLGGIMLKTGFVEDRSDLIYKVRRLFEEGFELYGIALFNCTLFGLLTPSTVGINFSRFPGPE
jgi:hypothetical protein